MERARESGTDGRVLAGRINTLISQQPVALAANVVLAVLLALVLSDILPHRWLAVWVAAVWSVTAWRGAIWFRHLNGLASSSDARSVANSNKKFYAWAVTHCHKISYPWSLFNPNTDTNYHTNSNYRPQQHTNHYPNTYSYEHAVAPHPDEY